MTTGKQILIVDDDTTLLEMLGEQLQLHEEFSTTGAKSAAEALDFLAGLFELILFDNFLSFGLEEFLHLRRITRDSDQFLWRAFRHT